jgi:dienelactone hydrolase
MKKRLIGLLVAVLLLGVIAVFRGEAIALSYMSSKVEKRTVAELSDLLVPHMSVREPAPDTLAAGPVPVLIQMHGCGGLNLERYGEYADIANQAGFLVVIVASNAPRGFDRESSLAEVCRGKVLLGQERAGDIVVALEHAFANYEIDRTRIVLAGWSHGAWSVMDYLSLDMPRQLPSSLAAYENAKPEIRASVLFYPYCGIGARSRIHGWTQSPDVLALMGDADTVVNFEACRKVFASLERKGAQNIRQKIYEGADHGFDNAHFAGPLADWYDADYAADARVEYEAFLRAITD